MKADRLSQYVLDKGRMVGSYRPCGNYVRFPATKGRFLYVMRIDGDLYKVGISGSPEYRRSALQCGLPFEIELLDSGICHPGGVDPAALESEVHRLLADHKVIGEWFRTTYATVWRAIIEAYIKLHCPPMYARLQRMRGKVAKEPDGPKTSTARTAKWREANKAKATEYHREYMRKYRAKEETA